MDVFPIRGRMSGMATTVGVPTARDRVADPPARTVPARRLGADRWRDPRLAVGVLLVAASVVLGVRVVEAADDTVTVWSARSDVSAGTVLTDADLVATQVHFAGGDEARLYLSAEAAPPSGVALGHDLRAGELLAASSLQPSSAATAELPLAVPDGSIPADLAPGDHVDVWVASEATGAAGGATGTATQVLSDVLIVSLDTADTALGGGAATRVLVALDDSAVAGLDETLATLASGAPVLVRRGG